MKGINGAVAAMVVLAAAVVGAVGAPATPAVAGERVFQVAGGYLMIPIRNGAPKTGLVVEVDGRVVRRYDAELVPDGGAPDWYGVLNLAAFRGKEAVVRVERGVPEAVARIHQSATGRPEVGGPEGAAMAADAEPLRPRFHFSQRAGWNNDPNGMVYLDGEWHLFFQHNPLGWSWGNMTWGHAVSPDLVNWRQLPEAFCPRVDAVGDCFSGGAVVDVANTSGWRTGEQDVLVAFLTDTGAGESVAYSNDRGRSFTWHAGNPVIRHKGRDPKVIWYAYGAGDRPLDERARELGGHWVMVLYNEDEPQGQNIAIHTSTNLREWTFQSRLGGYFECPELFALPVDGKADDKRWVITAADARYALGAFDGRVFTPSHEGKHQLHWGPYYAAQTFENAPGGRRIRVGWLKVDMPGMPFNQAFSFPHELSLRQTADGVRLFAAPVDEIKSLWTRTRSVSNDHPGAVGGRREVIEVDGDLLDVRVTFAVGDAGRLHLGAFRWSVVYDVAKGTLDGVPLKPVDGRITVRMLIDRSLMEVTGNDGRVSISRGIGGPPGPLEPRNVTALVEGGSSGRVLRLEVNELRPAAIGW